MFSALKHEGKALYEYAREGIDVERPARDVTIHALNLLPTRTETAQAAMEKIASSDWPQVEIVLSHAGASGAVVQALAEGARDAA